MSEATFFTQQEVSSLLKKRRLGWGKVHDLSMDPFERSMHAAISSLSMDPGDSQLLAEAHRFRRLYEYGAWDPANANMIQEAYKSFKTALSLHIAIRFASDEEQGREHSSLTKMGASHAQTAFSLFESFTPFHAPMREHIGVLGDTGRERRRGYITMMAHMLPLLELRDAFFLAPSLINAQRFTEGSKLIIRSPRMTKLLKQLSSPVPMLNRLEHAQSKLEDALLFSMLTLEDRPLSSRAVRS